jgi:Mn2+/Fe2+ NRAMP family transporter
MQGIFVALWLCFSIYGMMYFSLRLGIKIGHDRARKVAQQKLEKAHKIIVGIND